MDDVLSNKMLYFNGKTATFKKFNLRGKQDNCEVCGTNPTIKDTKDYDYEELCPTPPCSLLNVVKLPQVNDVTVQEYYKDKTEIPDKIAVIDCRPQEQFDIVNIPESICIPVGVMTKGEKDEEISDIAKSHEKVYILCRRGNQSRKATKYLLEKGIENVYNVRGGLAEYINDIEDDMPMY